MRHCFTKAWVTWLLVLMIPVQALAAVTQMCCGPQHRAIEMAPHAAHLGGHGRIIPDDHNIHHGEVESFTPELKVAADPVNPSTCSLCASCFPSVGLVPSPLPWGVSSTGLLSRAVSVQDPFIGFIPPGLERPPKANSA